MKNRKGFSLVELLAVVVVLGIIMMITIPAIDRWIDKGKQESDEGQKKTLVMAAQSYANGNSRVLPKVIGGTTTITSKELKDANFLKNDITDSNNRDCSDSYVKVKKEAQNRYKYTAYIVCEGESIIADNAEEKPIISISFSGNKNEDENIEDVAVSAFKIVIEGGSTSSKKFMLASYSYSISVRYSGNQNDKIVEIFNTGNIDANQKDRIVIEKSLSEYTDITKANDFIITVEAYNSVGGYRKQTADSSYKDNTPPVCGKITGQAANANDWLSTVGDMRTISVECSDGDGSGCTKAKYTKTFDTEMDTSVITISDNAGNKTDCRVKVQIDWTRPTLTIIAYVRNAGGGNGSEVGRIVANEANPNRTLDSFTGNINGWLNNASFPRGLNFDIVVNDNVKIASGQWSNNAGLLFQPTDGNIEVLTKGAFKTFTATDNTTKNSLQEQGIRRAKYELEDAAGNKVSIKIKAQMDRNAPSVKAHKENLNSEDGVHVVIVCADSESGCASGQSRTARNIKSNYEFSVKDVAGNITTDSIRVSNYSCHPYQCNPHKCNCKKCNCGYNACPSGMSYYGTHASSCCNAGGVCQKNTISCSQCCSTCYDTCYKTCYK